MLEEGHRIEIPDLPKLSLANSVAIEVWNILHAIDGVGFWDAIKILGLKLTHEEVYVLLQKLILIKTTIDEYNEKELERVKSKWHLKSM